MKDIGLIVPNSRTQAIKLRIRKYYTGRPCKYGHLAYRYTMTGACIDCRMVYNYEYHKRIKEAFAETDDVSSC